MRRQNRFKHLCFLLVGLCWTTCGIGQQDKRPLTHDDYDRWKTISGTQLSGDGNWLMFALRDGKENGELIIRQTKSAKEFAVKDATSGSFTFDSRYAAYRIIPNKETVRKLKKADTADEDLPQEKFQLLNLSNGNTTTIEQNKSYSTPDKNGRWIAILLKQPQAEKTVDESQSETGESFEVTPEGLKRFEPKSGNKQPKPEAEPSSSNSSEKEEQPQTDPKPKKEKESKEEKKKDNGTTLILRDLETGEERRFPSVTEFRFDEFGRQLAFATSSEEPNEDGVSVVDLKTGQLVQIVSGLGNYQNLAFNIDGNRLAFCTDRDDYEAKDSSWAIYLWRKGQSKANQIAMAKREGIPEDWWVSSNASPFFAENNRYLFFYTAPIPEDANQEDDEHKDPTAKLDIWHWQDPLLQPQQLIQAQQERNRSYIASYDLRTKKIHQLANKEIRTVSVDPKRDADIAIGISDEQYRKTISWDMPGYRDVFLVNIRSGKAEKILERIRNTPSLSPDGKWLIWWDTQTRHWYTLSTKNPDEKVNITAKINFPLFNELHDTPSDPSAHGVAGWTDSDESVLIYDRYDIWQVDPSGTSEPVCITGGAGRKDRIRYRVQRLDREARQIQLDQSLVLSAFDETTKDSGYACLADPGSGEANSQRTPEVSIMLSERLGGLQKARDADRLVFTRSTFERFPDIWTTTSEFKKITRMSKANPQQFEYSWGSVELTQWKATDGQEIRGMIYKPDDFDESKKYPMIVYFYERYSDRLHQHYAPAAGRSIINFTFYTSRGYVVFVPDIPYKTGEPGPSAANSVLPGVDHMIAMGFIDEDKIGMQGHSWGGYQTAYLATQTDRFACAESGAPVSNMTSAYGGIRWASGLSRMFQYERTQSRIGDTLWNAREKYIANSPLFFVDKINTPMLILHNDEDGAVPWYQGIELFVAMRRLEKPAWLLNYNGNPHWVMGRENRLDFARRMQQFFDHYLKDEPMPKWMSEGIPAIRKGKDFGFEHESLESEAVSQ